MFFTPTTFDGDNKMYCEICDAKVDATRKYVITHHPDVLLLMLKRFDFSYQFMSYIKINCNADVPHTIEIPENQTYELYAVVEHSGDLRGGHYQALIKSKDEGDEWFIFNDSSVTQLGINPFPDNVNVAQSIGAYLLFYRKKVADFPISDQCSVNYNPNIIQDQSPKEENLQPSDETETLKENISVTDDERKVDHMSTEAKPEKREINESEETDPDEEQPTRERQTEELSQDETKYPQDITMEDAEEQEENRNHLTAEDQIQGLVAGETEPTKFGNMQTNMNYDHNVDSAEPAASERQENLWKQGSAEDRTDEVRRKQEKENSNKLITKSEETGADDEAENMRYNRNEAERAALNKLEEMKQIGEAVSHLKESFSSQDPQSKGFSKIPQSLTPDEPNIDDKHQRRKEMTVDASKTQETENVDKTRVHEDKPKLDDGGTSKQKSQIRGKRKRSDQGKKENQDNTDRTGEDQVGVYSHSPQLYYDEPEKKNIYKIAATLTGNQDFDRDKETRQENSKSYRNKRSKGAEVKRQGSNQAAVERKTIKVDIREFYPGGEGKTELIIKTITEEITTGKNEGKVDRDLEDGVLLSEPLLHKQQNPTSKEITRGAKEEKYRENFPPDTDLEAQQKRHAMKKQCSCRCTCAIL